MADKLNQIVQAFSEMLAKQAEEQNNKMLQLNPGFTVNLEPPKIRIFYTREGIIQRLLQEVRDIPAGKFGPNHQSSPSISDEPESGNVQVTRDIGSSIKSPIRHQSAKL